MTASPPFRAEIDEALTVLNSALRTHGGGAECTGFDTATVRLRMTGVCAACLFKPVTLQATIAPYIRARLGLGVEVEGARISAEAQQRLAAALADGYDAPTACDSASS